MQIDFPDFAQKQFMNDIFPSPRGINAYCLVVNIELSGAVCTQNCNCNVGKCEALRYKSAVFSVASNSSSETAFPSPKRVQNTRAIFETRFNSIFNMEFDANCDRKSGRLMEMNEPPNGKFYLPLMRFMTFSIVITKHIAHSGGRPL